jgi:hypothetical protein
VTEYAAEHGTYARYQIEKRDGQVTCDACIAAARDYQRAYRQRTGRNHRSHGRRAEPGCSKGLGWPHANPALARILAARP